MTAFAAALAYAGRGWQVFPVWFNPDPLARKYPLTKHGMNDASGDAAVIREWWRRWPNAVPSILTGEPSGIVALDIDIRPDGSGFDTLDDLGVPFHLESPTAHTPQGGCAVLFRWPGYFVKTCAGRLGPHLDIRGDAGSLILPPGPGRFWDPHLGPDTPLQPMPKWMAIREPERHTTATEPVRPETGLSPYGEAALDDACRRIIAAPAGEQVVSCNGRLMAVWNGNASASPHLPPSATPQPPISPRKTPSRIGSMTAANTISAPSANGAPCSKAGKPGPKKPASIPDGRRISSKRSKAAALSRSHCTGDACFADWQFAPRTPCCDGQGATRCRCCRITTLRLRARVNAVICPDLHLPAPLPGG